MSNPTTPQIQSSAPPAYPKQITKTIIFEVYDKDSEDYLADTDGGLSFDLNSFASDVSLVCISVS
jgi:hypothetical protein